MAQKKLDGNTNGIIESEGACRAVLREHKLVGLQFEYLPDCEHYVLENISQSRVKSVGLHT